MNRWFIAACAALVAACTSAPPRDEVPPPVIFLHGNGDSAALWMTTVWRFESNGWPRERLFALDLAYPLARSDDAKPQEGRSSTAEHMAQLAAEVERARKLTGASKVALVGNSRGGNAIRNYIRTAAARRPCRTRSSAHPEPRRLEHSRVPAGRSFNARARSSRRSTARRARRARVTPGSSSDAALGRPGQVHAARRRWIGQPKLRQRHARRTGAQRRADVVLGGAIIARPPTTRRPSRAAYASLRRPGRTDIDPGGAGAQRQLTVSAATIRHLPLPAPRSKSTRSRRRPARPGRAGAREDRRRRRLWGRSPPGPRRTTSS